MKKMLNMSDTMNERLKTYCKANSVSNSQVVESALTLYLVMYETAKDMSKKLAEVMKIGDPR